MAKKLTATTKRGLDKGERSKSKEDTDAVMIPELSPQSNTLSSLSQSRLEFQRSPPAQKYCSKISRPPSSPPPAQLPLKRFGESMPHTPKRDPQLNLRSHQTSSKASPSPHSRTAGQSGSPRKKLRHVQLSRSSQPQQVPLQPLVSFLPPSPSKPQATPPFPPATNSSDHYYEEEDSAFLKALDVLLPVDRESVSESVSEGRIFDELIEGDKEEGGKESKMAVDDGMEDYWNEDLEGNATIELSPPPATQPSAKLHRLKIFKRAENDRRDASTDHIQEQEVETKRAAATFEERPQRPARQKSRNQSWYSQHEDNQDSDTSMELKLNSPGALDILMEFPPPNQLANSSVKAKFNSELPDKVRVSPAKPPVETNCAHTRAQREPPPTTTETLKRKRGLRESDDDPGHREDGEVKAANANGDDTANLLLGDQQTIGALAQFQGHRDVQPARGRGSVSEGQKNTTITLDVHSKTGRVSSARPTIPITAHTTDTSPIFTNPSTHHQPPGDAGPDQHIRTKMVETPAGGSNKRKGTHDILAVARFGAFGDYIRKKRAKLQEQNATPTDPNPNKPSADIRVTPEYAAHESNPVAQRLMANPDWRAAHTSVAPGFIEGFYKNSRMHHLSMWKSELKKLVKEAGERAGVGEGEEEGGETGEAGEDPMKDRREVSDGTRKGGDGGGSISIRGALLPGSASKGKGKEKAFDEYPPPTLISPIPNINSPMASKKHRVERVERVIMHCDFDCFFVAAGLTKRPELKGKPVVVCHSQSRGASGGGGGGVSGEECSTSEIASASYEARAYGIKNGMSLQQARKLCPEVQTIPYEFALYKELSLKFYTILMKHADDLQAVSVDEALLDVSHAINRNRRKFNEGEHAYEIDPPDHAMDLAELIRDETRRETGCEVSIGIAHNILLARLAMRKAKPASSYHLLSSEIQSFLAPLSITDIWGFGYSLKQKAQEKLGATTLGALIGKSKGTLCDALGKANGERLYNAIRGVDESQLESDKPRKSVSCEINYGIRFESSGQAEAFIHQMSAEASKRLKEVGVVGRSITLKIMKRDPSAPIEPPKFLGHGPCETYNKQSALPLPNNKGTDNAQLIGEQAWRMLKSFNFDPESLRGIGIQIQKLESTEGGIDTDDQQVLLQFAPAAIQPAAPQPIPNIVHSENSLTDPPEALPVFNPFTNSPVAGSSNLPAPADEPTVEPPNPSPSGLSLPSLSQIDKDVFDALPPEIRQEFEQEYKRRSEPPAHPPPPTPPPRDYGKYKDIRRIASALAPRRGAANGPRFGIFRNHLGIVQRPYIHNLSEPPPPPPPAAQRVEISAEKLRELDIDPDVFFWLSLNDQREQLIRARLLKEHDGKLPATPSQKLTLKAKPVVRPPARGSLESRWGRHPMQNPRVTRRP